MWSGKLDKDGNPSIYEDIVAKFIVTDEEIKKALINAVSTMELPKNFDVSKEDFMRIKEFVFDIKGLNLKELIYKRIYGNDIEYPNMFKGNEEHEIDWDWFRNWDERDKLYMRGRGDGQ